MEMQLKFLDYLRLFKFSNMFLLGQHGCLCIWLLNDTLTIPDLLTILNGAFVKGNHQWM